MRTRDFSRAPRQGQAGSLFIGATKYNSPKDWITVARSFRPMVKRMKSMPGYCWHTIYYEWPFTLGTIAMFETRQDMLTIARSPEHRALVRWVSDGNTDHATAGYIRLFSADEDGYTNGVWRAEDNEMQHIEEWTALPGESTPGRVDDKSSEIE